MNGKVDYATLNLGFCLEIYSNACVIENAQTHAKLFYNIAKL